MDLPNASIDFNALHANLAKGKTGEDALKGTLSNVQVLSGAAVEAPAAIVVPAAAETAAPAKG
jgi:hypothetical protein